MNQRLYAVESCICNDPPPDARLRIIPTAAVLVVYIILSAAIALVLHTVGFGKWQDIVENILAIVLGLMLTVAGFAIGALHPSVSIRKLAFLGTAVGAVSMLIFLETSLYAEGQVQNHQLQIWNQTQKMLSSNRPEYIFLVQELLLPKSSIGVDVAVAINNFFATTANFFLGAALGRFTRRRILSGHGTRLRVLLPLSSILVALISTLGTLLANYFKVIEALNHKK